MTDQISGDFFARENAALAERARRAMTAEQTLRTMTGPEAIEHLMQLELCNQSDLARRSGLTAATIGAFKKGKKPNAAQRAALCWAIARGG